MRVRKITALTGPTSLPGGCPDCLDTSRLEFTLLQTGQPKTIAVASKTTLSPPPADGLPSRTEMYVDFEVIGPEPVNDILQINVECLVNTPGVVGFVRAGRRQANGTWLWDWAQSEYGEQHSSGPCYYFHAPADASGGLYRNRRVLKAGFPSTYIYTDAADGNKRKIRLQLIHRAASPFTSTYDLVQAYRVFGIIGSSSASAAAYSSDVNLDGVVDASDAIQFIGEWMEGSETTNTNTDQSVDTDDLLNFEEAYSSGT